MNYPIKVTKTQHSRLDQVDFNNLPFGKMFSDHMFTADYINGEWTNLQILPFGDLAMHPASMVLHYGQAIFEGMKASKSVDGQPLFFRPELHAERLNKSARRMSMAELPEEIFLEGLHRLVDLDQGWIPPQAGSALYIRPFMIATDGYVGVKSSETYKFIIITCPVGPYYPKPISLQTEMKYVRAIEGGTGEAKAAGNYAASLLPARLAIENGYDQVMWMDGHDFKYVQEVGTMNIFFVIGDKIVTPSTDGAILEGITRRSVLELLKSKGFEIEIRPISIEEIQESHEKGLLKEVFGTGTAVVVANVSKIAHEGKEMVLPPVEERKVSPMIKSTIDGWRAGTIEDPFGWIVPVKTYDNVNA